MSLHLMQKSTPMLDASPPTPEELAWWEEAQKPIRRRTFLRAIPVGVGTVLTPLLLRMDESPWLVAVAALPILLGFGYLTVRLMARMQWRATERLELQSALAGRRIRERLRTVTDGDGRDAHRDEAAPPVGSDPPPSGHAERGAGHRG